MKCPVCGAKMVNGICIYCKNVTEQKVRNASNKKAIELIKQNQKEEVVYSTVLTSDINKKKLWLFTGLLGFLGVNNFYVGKFAKAWYQLISMVLVFLFVTVQVLSVEFGWGIENGFMYLVRYSSLFAAIGVFIYVSDIFALLFKKFKIPVVMED